MSNIGENGYEFVKAHAIQDTHGVYRVKLKDWVEYMNSHGLTREILDAKDAADNELINGMYRFNAERIEDAINKAKEEKRDPAKEKVTTTVAVLHGSVQLSSNASKVFPYPGRDERVTKYMVSSLDIDQQRQLNKELLAEYEENIKKCLSL